MKDVGIYPEISTNLLLVRGALGLLSKCISLKIKEMERVIRLELAIPSSPL